MVSDESFHAVRKPRASFSFLLLLKKGFGHWFHQAQFFLFQNIPLECCLMNGTLSRRDERLTDEPRDESEAGSLFALTFNTSIQYLIML